VKVIWGVIIAWFGKSKASVEIWSLLFGVTYLSKKMLVLGNQRKGSKSVEVYQWHNLSIQAHGTQRTDEHSNHP
jgi:hypothetical protein